MIFSELYSVYYTTVARIIEEAFKTDVTEKELENIVAKQAFFESVLTILPSLKSGKWPLLNDDLSPVLKNVPTMPLTTLEKRWLKSIADDPKIKLFGISIPKFDNIEPLFTKEDYKVFDKYSDGDPFEDEKYIKNFRMILSSIKDKTPLKATMISRHGKEISFGFYPKGFEYSEKDDKIRVLTSGCSYGIFNLGRVIKCDYCEAKDVLITETQKQEIREITLMIINKRNALERAMLHFAHFEKCAERLENEKYILKLKYYENDETEIVIRVLSFGPYIKVLEPESFVNLIKQRLISQKSCGLL